VWWSGDILPLFYFSSIKDQEQQQQQRLVKRTRQSEVVNLEGAKKLVTWYPKLA